MRIAVIGLGLIGGSIALAARQRLGAEVAGTDTDPSAREAALADGTIDRACSTTAEAVDAAQAAFVAVPVGGLLDAVGVALNHAPEECVVSDVGSTKRAIVGAYADSRFVGGHPMAGSEHSGLRHARGDLFEGATWFLTPSAATSDTLLERLRALLEEIGAHPRAIDAERHDQLVAVLSHLPHVIANVLIAQAEATLPAAAQALSSAGPSFRDATRVAGAPAEIWTDIYTTNADMLALAVEETVTRLVAFQHALRSGDRARIVTFIEAAAAARARLGKEPR
ncbi:MAG: prephenate dehydrogenase [Solirubrobacteraceae bacterium]